MSDPRQSHGASKLRVVSHPANGCASMTHRSKIPVNHPANGRWYLRLVADALVLVTFAGLAVSLATSFAMAG